MNSDHSPGGRFPKVLRAPSSRQAVKMYERKAAPMKPAARVANLLLYAFLATPIIYALNTVSLFIKTTYFGLVVFLLIVIAIPHMKSSEEMRGGILRMGRLKPLQVICLFYLFMLWLAAFRSGLHSNILGLLAISATMLVAHFLLPGILADRESVTGLIKKISNLGILVIALSWLMFLASVFSTWDSGVIKTAELVFEKKIMAEQLGLQSLLVGPFRHPNILGFFVVAVWPCLLMRRAAAETRKEVWLLDMSMLLGLGALIAALAVTSLIPVALTSAAALWPRKSGFHRLIWGFAIASLVIITIFIISGLDPGFLGSLPIPGKTRVLLWQRAAELIRTQSGLGMDSARAADLLPFGFSAHNAFFETALISGIPALLALSLYLGYLLVRLRPPHSEPLSACIFFMAVSMLILQFVEVLELGHLTVLGFYVPVTAAPYLLSSSGSPKGQPSGPLP
jgi:hypothetical protein